MRTPGLKTLQTALRALELISSVILLSIYSYTLGALSNRSLPTPTAVRAVEGIVGTSIGYAVICIILLRVFSTRTFPAFVLIVLDVAFAGAWIYVASANGGGAGSCSGEVRTHFGTGDAEDRVEAESGGFMALPTFGDACRLLTACLAIAIITIFLFVGSIATTIFLGRDHHAEKRKIINDSMDEPTSYPPLDSPKPDQEPPTKPKFSFKNMFRRKNTVRVQDTENALPQHTQPSDISLHRQSFQQGDDYAHVNSALGMTESSGRNGYQRVSVGHGQERPVSPETIYAEYDPTQRYTPTPPAPEPQTQHHSELWRPVDITGGAHSADLGEMGEARFPHGPYENLRAASTRHGHQGPPPAGYRYGDGVYDA